MKYITLHYTSHYFTTLISYILYDIWILLIIYYTIQIHIHNNNTFCTHLHLF